MTEVTKIAPDGSYEQDGKKVVLPADTPVSMNLWGLTPDIFDHIRSVPPGHGGEIQLTDAMRSLARERGMLAIKMQGERFDAGDWGDYLIANLHFALEEEHLQPQLLARPFSPSL